METAYRWLKGFTRDLCLWSPGFLRFASRLSSARHCCIGRNPFNLGPFLATCPGVPKAFTRERQQRPPVPPDEQTPFASPHLRKVDASKSEAGNKHDSPFPQRAMGNAAHRFCVGLRTIGARPGLAYFRFRDSNFRGRICHMKRTKIEPMFWPG